MVFKNPVTNNSIDHTLSAVRDLKIHLSRNFKKKIKPKMIMTLTVIFLKKQDDLKVLY